jgi:hypothetical protein
MSEADRTRKWREKRKAEGKKSFTILLSEEAQRIIKAEKETTGENYSAIIERALKSIKGPGYHRGFKFRPVSSLKPSSAIEDVTSNHTGVKSSPILIDDLQNYESIDTKTMSGLGLGKKENVLSRLVRSKFPGKKGWFK